MKSGALADKAITARPAKREAGVPSVREIKARGARFVRTVCSAVKPNEIKSIAMALRREYESAALAGISPANQLNKILVAELARDYKLSAVPVCYICGSALVEEFPSDTGAVKQWVCSNAAADVQGRLTGTHYADSKWKDIFSDARVIKLIEAYSRVVLYKTK